MSVKWHGAAVAREVRSKAARRLDKAAGVVKREAQALLKLRKGSAKRSRDSRRVRAWQEVEKYLKAGDSAKILKRKKIYKLGKGGKLRRVDLVWSGKTRRLRAGSKLLGARRAGRGTPPMYQTGRLHKSIRVTKRGPDVRQIGTHVFYGKILEPTHPFLLPALRLSGSEIRRAF